MSRSDARAADLSQPRGTPGDNTLVLTRVFDAQANTFARHQPAAA